MTDTCRGVSDKKDRQKVWWFEFVEQLRKAMMTGMLAALPSGPRQCTAGSAVTVAFLLVTCLTAPFRFSSDFMLQVGLLTTIYMVRL